MILEKANITNKKTILKSGNRLLCLFICISLIFTVLYIITAMAVSRELDKNNSVKVSVVEKNMYIAFEQLNNILKNGEELIREKYPLLNGGFDNISVENMVGIVDEINKLETYNPFIQEMLIFKKGEDNYITSQGIVRSDVFFNYDYGNTEYNKEYFDRVFYDYNANTVLPVREFKKMFNFDGESTLRIFIVPKIYKIYDAGIILMINEEDFIEYCGISEEDIGMKVCLYNHEGSLIISNSSDKVNTRLDITIPENKSQLLKKSILGNVTLTKWFDYEGMIFSGRVHLRTGHILFLIYLIVIAVLFLIYVYVKMMSDRKKAEEYSIMELIEPENAKKYDHNFVLSNIEALKRTSRSSESNATLINNMHLRLLLSGDTEGLNSPSFIGEFEKAEAFGMFIAVGKEFPDKDIKEALTLEKVKCQIICDEGKRHVGLIAFGKSGSTELKVRLDKIMAKVYDLNKGNTVILYSDIFTDMYISQRVYKKLSEAFYHMHLKDKLVCVSDVRDAETNLAPENISGEINKLLFSANKKDALSLIEKKLNELIYENPSYHRFLCHIDYYNMVFVSLASRMVRGNEISAIEKNYLSAVRKYINYMNVNAILQAFLDMVSQCIEKVDSDKQIKNAGEILKYIHENFRKEIYLENVSEVFNMKPKYFSYYFKREFGVGFNEYLTRLRIEEAKKLLKTTDDTVSAIAQKVGYFNQITFNTAFKKYEGITPAKYRNDKN